MGDAEAALRWRCRRGMKELDLLLAAYLEQDYSLADPAHQAAFRALLECQDPQILGYLLGRETPMEGPFTDVVDRLKTLAEPAA